MAKSGLRKKFNGEWYDFDKSFSTLRDAQDRARAQRWQGYKARVVRIGLHIIHVYIRKKK